jgi:phosphoribosylformylglycinamidine cyclo-ligase
MEVSKANPMLPLPGTDKPLRDVVLEPTRIYVKPVLKLMETVPVKAMAHITGGGLTENIPRVLPDGLMAQLDQSSWPRPELFNWLQKQGNVTDAEMHRTFNCGIGFVIVVAPQDAAAATAALNAAGERVFQIGSIRVRADGQAQTVVR